MNSFVFNVARMMGPSMAGLLIYKYGEGFCFLLNAVSFVVVIVAFA